MSKKRLLNQATYAQGTADSSAPLPELKVWDISIKDLQGQPADLADLSERGPFSAWGLVQHGAAEKSRVRIFPILEYSLDYPLNSACTVWIRTHDTWYHIQTVAKSYFKIWKKMIVCTNLLGFLIHHLLHCTGPNGGKFENVVENISASLKQTAAVTFDQLVLHSDFIFFQLQQQSASQVVKSDFLATLSLLLTGSSKQPLTSAQAREIIAQKRQNPALAENIGLLKRRAKRSNIVIELDSDSDADSSIYEHVKSPQRSVTINRVVWKGNERPCIFHVPSIESAIAAGVFQCIFCPLSVVQTKGQSNVDFVRRIQTHLGTHQKLNQRTNICNAHMKSGSNSLLPHASSGIKWDAAIVVPLGDSAGSLEWESTGLIPKSERLELVNEEMQYPNTSRLISDAKYEGLNLAIDDSDSD